MPDFELSIIIPHFENSKDLKRLLASIPGNNRFEVIVVDDYSSEVSFNELIALKEFYRFELLKNTGVKSAGTCRNIGLDKARGKCILFADSDDFFLETLEEQVYKYLVSDCDIVFFPPTSIYADTGKVAERHVQHADKIKNYISSPHLENENRLRFNWNCPWSKLYKTDFLHNQNIRFDEVIVANDVVFSLVSGIKAKRICVSNVTIYCSVSRRGSLEYTYSKEILEARIRASMRHRRLCQSIGFMEFGANALQWLNSARMLRFRDFLYLIKVAKKLGVFKDAGTAVLVKRFVLSFCRKSSDNVEVERGLYNVKHMNSVFNVGAEFKTRCSGGK